MDLLPHQRLTGVHLEDQQEAGTTHLAPKRVDFSSQGHPHAANLSGTGAKGQTIEQLLLSMALARHPLTSEMLMTHRVGVGGEPGKRQKAVVALPPVARSCC